ncbi:MBL fold metallo-hydrolase [Syntrophus aciditrophicus]|uniref:Zn-dependent hydrolases, including glyoxylases n=1 Tax=Syntrophus aciditrophicus (strain SB) TaxID=56780 RepID=Q2LXM2_SYNAS|nr:MBL fold metallo-hydrolase [Syntrophus aciditrophicus]ABC78833.1 zn-dependent hydrolases, including glyoxylases [Syntrophus aciditrophicus SB]OPY19333.1 MAG: putative metallo-hydrolase [Syntrophus sp. PtaB.Bin075]
MKFNDDIFVYEWTEYYDNNCNSYYIGGTAQVLIDPGHARYLPLLLDDMAKDGVRREDIRTIINTHAHSDHIEGSLLFNGSDVKIALHEADVAFYNSEANARLCRMFGQDVPRIDINLILHEGELSLGDETFQIVHAPGHSPGSIGLYWPRTGALFSGDVIFDQNVGRTDFPGGDGNLLKQSIVRLSQLGAEFLFPGHMGMVLGREQVKRNFEMVVQHVFPYI